MCLQSAWFQELVRKWFFLSTTCCKCAALEERPRCAAESSINEVENELNYSSKLTDVVVAASFNRNSVHILKKSSHENWYLSFNNVDLSPISYFHVFFWSKLQRATAGELHVAPEPHVADPCSSPSEVHLTGNLNPCRLRGVLFVWDFVKQNVCPKVTSNCP